MHIRQQWRHIGYLICALFLLGEVWQAPASAAIHYLSPTGADANTGTAAAPWKTFQLAIPKLWPGDTLILVQRHLYQRQQRLSPHQMRLERQQRHGCRSDYHPSRA